MDGLFRLRRAHVDRMAYETLSITPRGALGHRRRRIRCTGRVALAAGAASASTARRAGCSTRSATTWSPRGWRDGPDGPNRDSMTTPRVTVHGLSTDTNPDGNWYVDAGLGDALHEPVPLIGGQYGQGPSCWCWTRPRAPSVTRTSRTTPRRASRACLAVDCHRDGHLRRPPRLAVDVTGVGFVRVLTARRRDASGVDILRGMSLRRMATEPRRRSQPGGADRRPRRPLRPRRLVGRRPDMGRAVGEGPGHARRVEVGPRP